MQVQLMGEQQELGLAPALAPMCAKPCAAPAVLHAHSLHKSGNRLQYEPPCWTI